MIKTSKLFLILSAIMIVSAVSAFGQERTVAPEAAVTVERSVVVTTPQGPTAPVPPSANFVWFSTEFSFDGKLVKGAPYSAQAVTETTQTLSDGNRIVNTSTATLYRDGEGRTRREQTLKAVGNVASGEPMQIININDPVAGVSYSLDPSTHVARKNQSFRFERTPMPDGAVAGGVSGSMTFKVTTTPGAEPKVAAGGGDQFFMKREDSQGAFFKQDAAGKNFVKESLGKQSIEGVDAEGTRTTITIPAGTIGNERPIEIVDERWYSPSLQTVVMTRHSDPRSGEVVYRLTNIDRNEPAHSLFEVPADYQLKEGPAAPPAMRVRKPMD